MLNHQNRKGQKRYQSLSELEKIKVTEKKYQDNSHGKYQHDGWLDKTQFELYNVAMYGLSGYSVVKLKKIPLEKKRRITRLHQRAMKALNNFKQQRVNELFNKLCGLKMKKFETNPFNTNFEGTKIGIDHFGNTTDEAFTCTLSFKDLNVSREQIIERLIQERVFPENFFQLKKLV